MIDLVSVGRCYSGTREGVSSFQCELHQTFEVFELQFLAVIVDEKKPIATPRDIAGNWSIGRHVNCNFRSSPITRDVRDFDASFVIEMCDDDADRCLDAMCAGTDAIQVGQRGDDTDSPVPAHSQVTHAIEKDDTGYT